MPGIEPGMKTEGMAGEFSRYSTVLIKPPDDEDREEALEMALDTRCDTCEALLTSLMKRVESYSEDHILDQLEGVPMEMPLPTDDPQVNRVNAQRKGCNKHFKDELLYRGYYVKRCADIEADKAKKEQAASIKILDSSEPPDEPADEPDESDEEEDETPRDQMAAEAAEAARVAEAARLAEEAAKRKTHCLIRNENINANEQQVNTYNVRSEALFFGCEHTVGKYSQEIGTFIAEGLEEERGPLQTLIGEACRRVANCDGSQTKRDAGSRKARLAKAEKQAKKKAVEADEESVWEMLEREESAKAKKRRKTRKPRKSKGAHVEL